MLRKAVYLFVSTILTLFACSDLYAAVTVAPPAFSVARGQAGTITLQYQFTGITGRGGVSTSGVITSANGSFMAAAGPIGNNPAPVTVHIRGGSGTAAETVVIPVGVIERALRSGSTAFVYQRGFSNGDTAAVRITITSEAAASFSVKRVELYFDNRRAEITVPLRYPKLMAYADIRYSGSGLLEGYWEVDGRVISRVHRMLTFGGATTLHTPDLPGLPTFDPGTHLVRFVVTNRDAGLPAPVLVYFVTTEEFRPEPVSIELKSPREGSVAEKTARFDWEWLEGTAVFLVEFYEKPEAKPVFSAYTKNSFYLLPEQAFNEIFRSGGKYCWKVKGYSDISNIIGESAVGCFTLH